MTGCRYKWPHSTFQFQPARHNSPMANRKVSGFHGCVLVPRSSACVELSRMLGSVRCIQTLSSLCRCSVRGSVIPLNAARAPSPKKRFGP